MLCITVWTQSVQQLWTLLVCCSIDAITSFCDLGLYVDSIADYNNSAVVVHPWRFYDISDIPDQSLAITIQRATCKISAVSVSNIKRTLLALYFGEVLSLALTHTKTCTHLGKMEDDLNHRERFVMCYFFFC